MVVVPVLTGFNVVSVIQIVHRRIQRADRLALASAQLDILDKSLDEQKV